MALHDWLRHSEISADLDLRTKSTNPTLAS